MNTNPTQNHLSSSPPPQQQAKQGAREGGRREPIHPGDIGVNGRIWKTVKRGRRACARQAS